MTLPQPLSRSSGQGEIFRRCALNLMFNTRSLKSKIIPTQSLTSEPFGTFVHFFLLLRRGATERYSKQKKRSTSINYSLILQFRPIPIPGSFSFQMLFCASTLTVLIVSPLTAHDTSTVTNGSELDIGDPQLGQRLEPKMLATEIYRELRYCRPFGSASLIYLD